MTVSYFQVEMGGLTDFRTLVTREMSANVRPAATNINADHERGVGFGRRSGGTRVAGAQSRYQQGLRNSITLLATYVETARLLAQAVNHLRQQYEQTDLDSSGALAASMLSNLEQVMVAPANVARFQQLELEFRIQKPPDYHPPEGWTP